MSDAQMRVLTESTTMTLLRQFLRDSEDLGPAVAKRAGLSHSELDALELLFDNELGPSEIAKHLGVTTAAATGIVDRLNRRGHITTRPHESDGRKVLVTISPSGAGEVWHQLSPMFLRLRALDASLGDDERRIVDDFLTRASDAIRAAIREAGPSEQAQ